MASAKPKPDIAVYLLTLCVIAIVAIAGLAAITQHRDSYATEMLHRTTTPVASNADGLLSLANGITASATAMGQRLGSDRSAAIVAGDAAMRAAEVGRYAAAADMRQNFDSVANLIASARHDVQNGRDSSAAATVMRAASVFGRLSYAADSATVDTRQSVRFGDYDGATLIDSRGAVLGYVTHVSPSQDGTPSSADIVIGGAQHLLGFLNFGGTHRSVPVSRLVFGEPRTVGEVLIALINTSDTTVANDVIH